MLQQFGWQFMKRCEFFQYFGEGRLNAAAADAAAAFMAGQ